VRDANDWFEFVYYGLLNSSRRSVKS